MKSVARLFFAVMAMVIMIVCGCSSSNGTNDTNAKLSNKEIQEIARNYADNFVELAIASHYLVPAYQIKSHWTDNVRYEIVGQRFDKDLGATIFQVKVEFTLKGALENGVVGGAEEGFGVEVYKDAFGKKFGRYVHPGLMEQKNFRQIM